MSRYNQSRRFPQFLFIVLSILVLGYLGYYFYKNQLHLQEKLDEVVKMQTEEKQAVTVAPTIISSDSVQATTWIDVQRQVQNTVVKIISNVAVFNWLEPYKTPEMGQISGSGFFINGDGDIVTNFHNINQCRSVQIEVPALGKERLDVEIVGASPERDLALLRLTKEAKDKIGKELEKIPFLKFGDSDLVQRGQNVLALGFPLNVQALKSTQGIVSGRERVRLINSSCIQTTAPLNPGNSGGPAIDSSGRVIGINFAGAVQAQNVGFIIPINDVKNSIKDLYKIKLLRRPSLGCAMHGVNEDMVKYLGNPSPGGFYVSEVFKNSVFEKVGVQSGDMIYEINGFKINRFGEVSVPWNEDKVSILEILDRLEVGDKVYMDAYRKGEQKEIEFILEPRFIPPIRVVYPDFEEVDCETIAGLVVMELAQNHLPLLAEHSRSLLAYESSENQYEPALIISYVQPTSLAFRLRLVYPGIVIKEVNGEEVKTLKEFREAVKKSRQTRFLTIKTKESYFIVFSVDNIVQDEDRLARLYSFEKSPLIDAIS